MKVLVIYYSRTGTTAILAKAIAAALDAELEPIADRERRGGWIGWLRCGFQGAGERLADIGPASRDPTGYDLVVIGGPVWSGKLSSPVRSYLRRHRGSLPTVAFFYTCGGTGNERVFDQMIEEVDATPIATLALREADIARAPDDAARFATEITHALATRTGAAR